MLTTQTGKERCVPGCHSKLISSNSSLSGQPRLRMITWWIWVSRQNRRDLKETWRGTWCMYNTPTCLPPLTIPACGWYWQASSRTYRLTWPSQAAEWNTRLGTFCCFWCPFFSPIPGSMHWTNHRDASSPAINCDPISRFNSWSHCVWNDALFLSFFLSLSTAISIYISFFSVGFSADSHGSIPSCHVLFLGLTFLRSFLFPSFFTASAMLKFTCTSWSIFCYLADLPSPFEASTRNTRSWLQLTEIEWTTLASNKSASNLHLSPKTFQSIVWYFTHRA